MKKIFAVIAICALLATALVGCGGADNSAQSTNSSTTTNSAEPSGAKEQKNQSSGDIGPYHFEINSTARTEAITDGTAVVIKYTITNNSDENIQPGMVTRIQVFQKGVSLEGVTIMGAADGKLMENQSKTIQPGATIEVEQAFTLNDTTKPINISVQLKAAQPNSIKLIDGMLKTDITID